MIMKYLEFSIQLLITIVLVLFSVIIEIFKFFIPEKFRMKSVHNKIVLITGAGSGVGAALAVRFAKLKCQLILWDVNVDGLQKTIEECRKYQSESLINSFNVDVTKRKQVLETAEQIKSDIGFVDILINNAGIVSGKSILELDEISVEKTFNVNVISHFWTVQAFLPEMISRNNGHIVSIASLAGLIGANKLSDYCASKFAAIGFQESLLNEIRFAKKSNIQVLTVCPFYINTGMFKGVKTDCPIFPLLQLDYVTEKIVNAILTNATLLYIPKIAYLMDSLKHILPVKGISYLADLVKVNHSMESFYGRQ